MPASSLNPNDPSSAERHPPSSDLGHTSSTLPAGSYQSSSSQSSLPLLDLNNPARKAYLESWDNFPTEEREKWAVLGQRLATQPFGKIPGATPFLGPQPIERPSASDMVESQSIDQRPDELIFEVPADSSMQTG
jgi:hypothetical protein